MAGETYNISSELLDMLMKELEECVQVLLEIAARDVRRSGCLFGPDDYIRQILRLISLVDELRGAAEALPF